MASNTITLTPERKSQAWLQSVQYFVKGMFKYERPTDDGRTDVNSLHLPSGTFQLKKMLTDMHITNL